MLNLLDKDFKSTITSMFKEKNETKSKGLQDIIRMLSYKMDPISKENKFTKCRDSLGVETLGKGMLSWNKDHGFSSLYQSGEKTHLSDMTESHGGQSQQLTE